MLTLNGHHDKHNANAEQSSPSKFRPKHVADNYCQYWRYPYGIQEYGHIVKAIEVV